MTFILKYWRVSLLCFSAVAIGLIVWWVCGLLSDNRVLRNQATLMQAEINYKNGFIEKYEKSRKENEAKQKKLADLVKGIDNDPNCLAPDSFRKFIDSL